ncbi:DUF4845 domain-containing protein [Glaciimonas immobilis]|uniref:DUF4845 domain-containing protein n=1 Tax=Glaciimonas immobilis TaxID=728004 RepID=A0A840RNS6_9BURK|nr:DUF4845 domain-containing protein [Glaciimonas immobilis]KAF3997965.1 DUF4845 domain-containing protein [Glaciimonas immobilis]MBB5199365.1 hypothetical protein [Glaciimonas immobilis]
MTKIAMKRRSRQQGITLFGLIVWVAILGFGAMMTAKVVPTVIEYMSIKKAIASVKLNGGTVKQIQDAFDRQAEVGYIDALHGKDLGITKNGEDIEISFAYQKTIPLVAPVSLLIDYSGTTARSTSKKTIN